MSLVDYETLKARYARGYTSKSTYVPPTTRMEWPQRIEHHDLDPLLRAALRTEAERKATAAAFNKAMGRIMSRKPRAER
jgi:O-acetyl-ADP-ribose deacetylase (regulator of RNase III)